MLTPSIGAIGALPTPRYEVHHGGNSLPLPPGLLKAKELHSFAVLPSPIRNPCGLSRRENSLVLPTHQSSRERPTGSRTRVPN
jgi:hypothetical protein